MEHQPLAALGATEVHDIRAEAIDADVRIFTAACGQDPQSTLVITDGNGQFGLATDIVRLMQIPGLVPAMTVVGIGYTDAPTLVDAVKVRARDLTPTPMPSFAESGGADQFAQFLGDQLIPWIAERFPGATRHLSYFGHSLGGLFGTYILLTNPALFDQYILSSPSLWWDRELLFAIEGQRAEHNSDLAANAYFGIGSLETDAGRRAEAANLPVDHPLKPPDGHLDMVDDMRRFTSQLAGRAYPSLDLHSEEFADEFHATVPGVVLSRGLRHFWKTP